MGPAPPPPQGEATRGCTGRGASCTGRRGHDRARGRRCMAGNKGCRRARTGRARTGRARTGRARTGRARTGRARTGRARTGRARTGRARTGRARTGRARTGRARTGRARTGRARTGRARTGGASGRIPAGLGADRSRQIEHTGCSPGARVRRRCLFAVFAAPASQFQTQFLRQERHYSAISISVLQQVAGTIGAIGVLVGGRLADTHGRRPVAVICVAGATLTIIWSYLAHGWLMWCAATAGQFFLYATAPVLGVYGAELFATSTRRYCRPGSSLLCRWRRLRAAGRRVACCKYRDVARARWAYSPFARSCLSRCCSVVALPPTRRGSPSRN